MTYTFYLVLQLYQDGSTLFQFNDLDEALKRFIKHDHAVLYEMEVGAECSIREVLRKEPEEESEPSTQ